MTTVALLLAAAGLCCADGGPCPPPAPGPSADFLPSGRLVLGANYWASHAATQMWSKWNAAEVDRDLKALADSGMTLLRVFANWAEFQPIVEIHTAGGEAEPRETRMFLTEELRPDTPAGFAGVDERMMERFDEFCDIAERHGLGLIVCPLTGQMTFRLYVPPAFEGKNVYSNPYCLKWEARYLKYFVERLKGKKAIVAWESGNESRIISRTEHHDIPEFWLTYVHDIIRRADPTRPVIGPDGLNPTTDHPWNSIMLARLSDCLATHPYAFWGAAYNDDFRSVRSVTYCAALTAALADIGGVPAFVEEHGSRRQEQASQRHVADYMRNMLWNAWDADCRGMLWWCAFDQTGQEIAPYDWKEPCVELGIFKRDRTPYPALEALKKFAAFQRTLPFEALPRPRPDCLFIVSDENVVHSAYVLAKQAGLRPEFQSAEQPLRDAKVYFLPSCKGRGRLTLRAWRALKEKVAAGATLYLSLDDTFLDELEAVAGIEIDSREVRNDVMACGFPGFDLTLGSAVKRSFRALTAETVASAKDGRGVFFRNRYGKGCVYTLVAPLETQLYKTSGQYASEAYRIYNLVFSPWRVLRTNSRDVIATEHCFGGGTCGVVIVNNSPTPYSGMPAVAPGWTVKSALTDDPALASWRDGKLELGPNAGILLMAERTDRASAAAVAGESL